MGGPAESRDPGGVTEHRSGSAAFLCTTATTERAAPFTASGMGEAAGRNGDDGQAEILQTAMNVITARVIPFKSKVNFCCSGAR